MIRHTDGRSDSRTIQGTRIARRIAGTVVCLAACLPGTLRGQEAASPPAAPAAGGLSGTIQRVEATPGNRVELLKGRGVIITLTKPAQRAAVGNPRVAEATVLSPQQVMLSGVGLGATNLILWDADDGQIIYDVAVQPDVTMLRVAIERTAPHTEVQAIPVGEKILLRGTVPDVDTAQRLLQLAEAFVANTMSDGSASGEGGANAAPAATAGGVRNSTPAGGCGAVSNVINQLTVAGENQVMLRCTVAEVSKSAVRQLGINGWLAGDNLHDVFVVNQIDGINPVNIGAAGDFGPIGGPHATRMPFATDQNGLNLLPGTTFSLGFPRVQMQLFFKAMRQNNLLRVLAEPNLMALSGQEASFLAGGEFPLPVPQGLGTTTIEWREFGVRLRFTPTVVGKQVIRLRVMPEVSERDFTTSVTLETGTVVPGLKSRRAETTIELASGSTLAIAGLLSEQVQAASKKVPALGDVPVLGALFSSVEYQKNQTELVILVTPEVVSSLQPDQVQPVPGQFARDPNDFELFALGMVEGKPACHEADPASALEIRTPPRYPKLTSPPDQMTLHGPWGPAEGTEPVQ